MTTTERSRMRMPAKGPLMCRFLAALSVATRNIDRPQQPVFLMLHPASLPDPRPIGEPLRVAVERLATALAVGHAVVAPEMHERIERAGLGGEIAVGLAQMTAHDRQCLLEMIGE